MGQDTGHRRGHDLIGLGTHGHRRRHADEDQNRGHQEAATDPENTRDQADTRPNPEDHEEVQRHLGNGQIDLHCEGVSNGRLLANADWRGESLMTAKLRAVNRGGAAAPMGAF